MQFDPEHLRIAKEIRERAEHRRYRQALVGRLLAFFSLLILAVGMGAILFMIGRMIFSV
jgi:hypothetical protein